MSDVLRGVALRIAQILGEGDYLLVGGLAVGAHGYARATDDVDFIVRTGLREVRKRLEAHGIPTSLKTGDPLEGDFSCLRGTLDGIRFDIMPPLVALDWEQAIEVPVTATARLRVVDLEGLLRLKFRAQGIQDLLDAAVLVLRHPEYLDRAREMAARYRVLEKFDSFLQDSRTRATAEDVRQREESRGVGFERLKNVSPKRPRRRRR